ncbi:MAG: hypothetical protein EXR76_10200 [Myxococcales bacterium]|nr:hypothetical protein [Myxococcales bacterium]
MSSKKKRLLAPEVLEAATEEVLARAHTQGVRAALAGGFALQQWGSPRLTGDVELVVEQELEGLKEVGRLSFGGQKLETTEGVPVDANLRDDEYAALYEEALNVAPVDLETGWRIISPEYLLAMKRWRGERLTEPIWSS